MTDGPDRDDPDDGAERRVVGLLGELAQAPAPEAPPVTDAVLATARWQTAVRGAAVLLGELAAGAADSLSLLLGLGRKDGGR